MLQPTGLTSKVVPVGNSLKRGEDTAKTRDRGVGDKTVWKRDLGAFSGWESDEVSTISAEEGEGTEEEMRISFHPSLVFWQITTMEGQSIKEFVCNYHGKRVTLDR